MVFKPFTTLARQSISKHLVHGYAQSVVAASQSSYASSTLPLHRTSQQNTATRIQNAFGGANSSKTAPGKDGHGSDGLNSLHASQSQEKDGETDKKYLFSRKILWSKAQHQQQQKQLLGEAPEPVAEPKTVRSRSDSVLLLSDVAAEPANETADVANTASAKQKEAAREIVTEDLLTDLFDESSKSPTWSTESATLVPSQPETPTITAQYNRQLQSLRDEGRYQEIAAVFQHMVEQGIPPSTSTYNLLLTAVVKLGPRGVTDVVDIYRDMLRMKLIPTTATYSILIEYLSVRAIDSSRMIATVEDEASRFGVMFPSKDRQIKELRKEQTVDLALELFYASTELREERSFPKFVYSYLVEACAKTGRESDMLNVYAHMEKHEIEPTTRIIRALIQGFGKAGDIDAAVETYNAYHEMDIAQDPALMDERYSVYQDLIKAYMDVGDAEGALTFLEKVVETNRERSRLDPLTKTVAEGFVSQNDHASARTWVDRQSLDLTNLEWFTRMLVNVADKGEVRFANQLYAAVKEISILGDAKHTFTHAQLAVLALCVRQGLVREARAIWEDLVIRKRSYGPDIPAAVSYTSMLFQHGLTNEALVTLNHFGGAYLEWQCPDNLVEAGSYLQVDLKRAFLQEAFEHLIVSLSAQKLLTPSIALDLTGFSLSRCGGLGMEASRRVLDAFDSPRLLGLSAPQLHMLLQLQTSVLENTVASGSIIPEDAQIFEEMFSIMIKPSVPLVPEVYVTIEKGISILSATNPELSTRWASFIQKQAAIQSAAATPFTTFQSPITPATPARQASPTIASEVELFEDNYDPYLEKTDVRVSHAIENILERAKVNRINDVRRMYRNTRKAGKTIQMTTLGKIIASATRFDGYSDFIEEIYRNAKVDTPLMMEHGVSKFGWCVLLDALVAGHLNLGQRAKASLYHDEMLQMGASPSANTYGLYIVSLKDSHQTYDEASEAVKIFERAKAENVLPSSFLYNALIGKLAKARRVDDCLFYFAEMRALGIKPTSVTYGTMINALTRVGDEHFAEELFQEMESMPNYKPRPAPYNSLMQFFISTRRDRSKVLVYYERMCSLGIAPTSHTYKLLIEAYATLDEPDIAGAEAVLKTIRTNGQKIESAHHAALIHAKGCVLHDVEAAIAHFESAVTHDHVAPDSTLYQALLECLVANHRVQDTPRWVEDMKTRGVVMTPYIANTLIHGWALEKNIVKAKQIYESLRTNTRREPSTYEAMTRAYLAVEDKEGAINVVSEMRSRGYPNAVMARVMDLVRGRETKVDG